MARNNNRNKQDPDLAIITQVELRHSLHFMDQLSRTMVGKYLEILARIVVQGQQEGEFRSDLDPIFAAKSILAFWMRWLPAGEQVCECF